MSIPSFGGRNSFKVGEVRGAGVKDLAWLNPSGQEMNDDEWGTHFVKTLGVLLCGGALDVRNWEGEPITDDTFLLLLNASHETVDFTLPNQAASRWATILDTVDERGFLDTPVERAAGEKIPLAERSFLLLRGRP